ncbi:MAG: hypothetical protein A3A86_00530 [Elusimicrobia bacterium RIFCSPLOWO2_01_FULL_60_11]|nr:MAG: hypothetical protein A3A86_00530 [Elusimicrobia bacterium RIFCSPLOWO2_01_FULL_60_11]
MSLGIALFSAGIRAADEPVKIEYTVVAVEIEGAKFWLPNDLIVNKGDPIKLNLVNNIKSEPNTHGYSIDEFGVKQVVARGETRTVVFTASKAGLFKIYCQMHPKHIGGRLLVLEK